MKKIMLCAALALVFSIGVISKTYSAGEDISLEANLKTIYQNAEKATKAGDIKKSDFWMARYMGLTMSDETKRGYPDLVPLFKERSDLKPVSFISGHYTDEFIDFFIRGTYPSWGIPDEGVTEEDNEFVIQAANDGTYFAQLAISPYLENWYITREPAQIRIIPFGDWHAKPPQILAGKLKNGETEKVFPKFNLKIGEHPLHYVWPIEFHDLDRDEVPEIWIRYNAAWGSGFSQMLDIYKIKNDQELVLLKQFEGPAEGIAKRLKDGKIQVAEGFSDKSVGHMGFDQHRLETWEYKNGDFVKISEKNIPHILRSDEWKKYYFD